MLIKEYFRSWQIILDLGKAWPLFPMLSAHALLKVKMEVIVDIKWRPRKGSARIAYLATIAQGASDSPGVSSHLHLTHWHAERPKQAWLFCWYFPHKSVFIKNIWRRNVYQNITNNSPSNILWEFALFSSYFQKYENSRRYFPGELWVWMG